MIQAFEIYLAMAGGVTIRESRDAVSVLRGGDVHAGVLRKERLRLEGDVEMVHRHTVAQSAYPHRATLRGLTQANPQGAGCGSSLIRSQRRAGEGCTMDCRLPIVT